jgi:Lactate racemase N-terminal domain
VPRVPLHSGSRLPLVTLPDDAVLLAAPPPLDPIADVEEAVVEALRYPLDGEPLDTLATAGGHATIVVQPPSLPLPLPAAQEDPRREALGAVVEEVERVGFARDRITLLVAGGLGRRAGRRDLDLLLRPEDARAFRGSVAVHDCEAEDLRPLTLDHHRARAHPALVETDLVITVGAAETVLHGGPGALLDACGAGTIRAASVESLLEPAGSDAWHLATSLEARLRERAPVVGLSLVLDRPRSAGHYRGYPWDAEARHTVARSPFRRLLNAAPSSLRRRALAELPYELEVLAALAGSPSVAHAEALVRGTAVRSVTVEPFETLVVPVAWEGPQLPGEPLNPIAAAATGLGYALRLWRDEPPLARGGTVVLLHPFSRVMGHASQAPYRALFAALREGGERLGAFEAAAARDGRGLAAYGAGTAPHPRLPFADWESCRHVLERAGRVIVAGCRDAAAARALGLVPSHNTSTALAMAAGLAEGGRTGVLLGPPYPALAVAGGST